MERLIYWKTGNFFQKVLWFEQHYVLTKQDGYIHRKTTQTTQTCIVVVWKQK